MPDSINHIYRLDDIFSGQKFHFKIETQTYAVMPEGEGWPIPMDQAHTHDYSEIMIILGGTGKHYVDDSIYDLAPGDIFVINGTVSHAISDIENLTVCNINYDPSEILTQCSELRALSGFNAMFLYGLTSKSKDFVNTIRLNKEELSWLKLKLELIERDFIDKKIGFETLIFGELLTILVKLSRVATDLKVLEFSPKLRLYDSVEYIKSHYRDKISITELAAKAHLSLNQFSKVFKENFMMTPKEYIIQYRTKQAANDLLESDLSITQVAFKHGFTDGNYFTKVLKRLKGCTPKEYRGRGLSSYKG
ncbi:MAG: helix-turn-helix domain-containing protein [Planctomycetes bacterium]|nr:helix-turn-helix domain-containing protein [Planctomycetota bacterium]